jgi:DNA-binding CsgD family transcriptional regulator
MQPRGRPNVSALESSDHTTVAGLVRDPENVVTPRQLELLALYASGMNYAEIGAIKFLSPYTVRNTLGSALTRSGARNLTHLCSILIWRHVIERDGDSFRPVQDMRIV